MAHGASGYEEWGVSGAIRMTLGASARGLTLSVAPEWGRAGSASARLWSARDTRTLGNESGFEPTGRLVVDTGYSFGLGAGRGVLSPYAGMTFGEASSRTVRGGAKWALGDIVRGFEAVSSDSPGTEPESEVRVRAALRF